MLCTNCQNFPPELFGNEDYDHHHSPSYNALQASAKAGCPSCTLISLSFTWMSHTNRKPTQVFDTDDSAPVILSRRKEISTGPPLSSKAGERFGTLAVRTDLGLDVGNPRAMSHSADDERTFQSIRECISTCLDSHSNCPKPDLNGPLPTRLLDVGPGDGSVLPRLCHGEEARITPYNAQYTTLSYCWGTAVTLRTTKKNIAQMMSERGIPWDSLPRTIQDAIRITRSLRIRHIWIDALCIIQDDDDDWRREAATMGEVYSRAVCTIAALHSSSCQDGIFRARNPLEVAPVTFHFPNANTASNHRSTYKNGKGDTLPTQATLYPYRPTWTTLNETSPLNRRGWTLQERELSPRVLFFTTHQTVWQCLSTEWAEDTLTLALSTPIQSTLQPIPPTKRWLLPTNSNNQKDTYEPYASWYKTVKEFSPRQFTYTTDKLIALSGLAKKVHSQTNNDTYVAGLWKADLLHGLAWSYVYTSEGEDNHRSGSYSITGGGEAEGEGYIAPSWSWLSIDGPGWIFYEGDIYSLFRRRSEDFLPRLKYQPEIVGVDMQVKGQDPFGQLTGGRLTLKGWVKRMECRSVLENRVGTVYAADGDGGVEDPSVGQVYFDVKSDAKAPCEGYFLCLCDRGVQGEDSGSGLWLVRVDDAEEGVEVYRRVGYVPYMETKWLDEVPREVILV